MVKRFAIILITTLVGLVVVSSPVFAAEPESVGESADSATSENAGNNNDPTQAVCKYNPSAAVCSGKTQTAESLAKRIVDIMMYAVGIIAVVMIIYAGYIYVRSVGDQAKLATAKQTIVYAVIGLVVAIAARAIVEFVLDQL